MIDVEGQPMRHHEPGLLARTGVNLHPRSIKHSDKSSTLVSQSCGMRAAMGSGV